MKIEKTKTRKGIRCQPSLEVDLEGDVKEITEWLVGIGDKPECVGQGVAMENPL